MAAYQEMELDEQLLEVRTPMPVHSVCSPRTEYELARALDRHLCLTPQATCKNVLQPTPSYSTAQSVVSRRCGGLSVLLPCASDWSPGPTSSVSQRENPSTAVISQPAQQAQPAPTAIPWQAIADRVRAAADSAAARCPPPDCQWAEGAAAAATFDGARYNLEYTIWSIATYSYLDIVPFVAAIHFIDRLAETQPGAVTHAGLPKLFAAALCVAIKAVDEYQMRNSDLARATGLGTAELCECEALLLRLLDFEVGMSNEAFHALHAVIAVQPRVPPRGAACY